MGFVSSMNERKGSVLFWFFFFFFFSGRAGRGKEGGEGGGGGLWDDGVWEPQSQ